MEFYEIEGDLNYLWLNCMDGDITGLLNHVVNDGAYIDRTKPIEIALGDTEKPGEFVETDFPKPVAYGVLTVSERAITVLGDLLLASGYFIDTTCPTETRYKIYICEREIDALDQENSEIERYPDGGIRRVFRHELNAEALQEHHVFRLKHIRSSVFASGTFVNLVNKHDLTGLHMTKIWSSETGGLPYRWPEFASHKEELQKRRLMRERIARRESQQQLASK